MFGYSRHRHRRVVPSPSSAFAEMFGVTSGESGDDPYACLSAAESGVTSGVPGDESYACLSAADGLESGVARVSKGLDEG